MASATSSRPSDRTAASPPTGSCRSGWPCPGRRCPAPSRGSARTARTCRARSRRFAERRRRQHPELPASTAASSDRMSPNRFSVTMTSKSAGRRIEQHRARIDELVADLDVRGSPALLVDDPPPQARRRQDVGLVDAGHASTPQERELEREPARCAGSRPRCRASCRRRVARLSPPPPPGARRSTRRRSARGR